MTRLSAAQPVGAAYLEINPSARLAAMGSSGAAIVTDASSLFANPAGLALAENKNLFASHTDLFLDNRLDALGYAQSTSLGVIGVSALYLSRAPIEGRADDRSATGSFDSSDAAFGLSYARALSDRVRWGFTLKGLQQKIASESATGAALDLGAQVKLNRSFTGGLALTNAGPGMKFIVERDALPTDLNAGLGMNIGMMLISVDAKAPLHGGKGSLGFGAEFMPFSYIALRGGYLMNLGSSISDTANIGALGRFAGFGAGLGIRLGKYTFDYTLSPSAEFSPTQIFTLSARF